MPYYVYIIRSSADGSYYKGFTEDPISRIMQHNEGNSKYTSGKLPWTLIYVEELSTKRDALIRERALKKYSHAQIESLILSGRNIVRLFS